jgi:hypothetical protein
VEKRGGAVQATDDNITRRMRFACWITKAYRHTQNMLILFLFPTTPILTRTRFNVTFHTSIACVV